MKSDFTFAKDDAQRFLPWHIGIMVALASFLLSLVLALGGWVGSHEADYRASFAVIIPGNSDKLDDKTTQVKALLAAQTDIASVTQVSEPSLRSLLAPWIGKGDALQDIALPVILDITLKNNSATPNIPKLIESLEKIDPMIELDTHNSWADVFAAFVSILQGLAILLVLTILGAMSLMIVFSARASLHMHGRTVGLLHNMGAEDDYIARQFQQEHFYIGLRAAAIGTACAVLAYWALGLSVAHINAPVLPDFAFTQPHALLFFAMPIICALMVRQTTRISVLAQLGKIL